MKFLIMQFSPTSCLVPDPLLLRKSGSAGNRTRDLWVCSQELLDHRCGQLNDISYEKCDWGTLVPRINVKNVIKLGFILELLDKE
jgi:hypothetical protein